MYKLKKEKVVTRGILNYIILNTYFSLYLHLLFHFLFLSIFRMYIYLYRVGVMEVADIVLS